MEQPVEILKAERAKLQDKANSLSTKIRAVQDAETDVAAIRSEAEALAREEIEAQAHALATKTKPPDFAARRQAQAERLRNIYFGKSSPDDLSELRRCEQQIGARLTEINSALSELALQSYLDGLPKVAEVTDAIRALMQAEARRDAVKGALLALATRFENRRNTALAHKCRVARELFCSEEKRIHVERSPSFVERLQAEMLASFDAALT